MGDLIIPLKYNIIIHNNLKRLVSVEVTETVHYTTVYKYRFQAV